MVFSIAFTLKCLKTWIAFKCSSVGIKYTWLNKQSLCLTHKKENCACLRQRGCVGVQSFILIDSLLATSANNITTFIRFDMLLNLCRCIEVSDNTFSQMNQEHLTHDQSTGRKVKIHKSLQLKKPKLFQLWVIIVCYHSVVMVMVTSWLRKYIWWAFYKGFGNKLATCLNLVHFRYPCVAINLQFFMFIVFRYFEKFTVLALILIFFTKLEHFMYKLVCSYFFPPKSETRTKQNSNLTRRHVYHFLLVVPFILLFQVNLLLS